MRDVVEQFKKGNHTLTITRDEYPQNPRREWDNLGTMLCFHKRYNLGDKTDIKEAEKDSWKEWEEYIEKTLKAVVILPIYMYDHSGITIRTIPFSCNWDSGQIGFIYVDEEKISDWYNIDVGKKLTKKTLDKAKKQLLSEVETYDAYLTGDVYCFNLDDENEDTIDACSGFYGATYKEDMKQHLDKKFHSLFKYPIKN